MILQSRHRVAQKDLRTLEPRTPNLEPRTRNLPPGTSNPERHTMCGIAGFIGVGADSTLCQMTGALAHRGPDGEGYWIDDDTRAFLGHRRLSILDIAAGSQPMTTMDGELVITFNGEIYNHAELRAALEKRGHRFKTDHSDTEVLLYGYREWGPGLPEKLNGMWAFAIYDRNRRELFLCRDRFGKKPLFIMPMTARSRLRQN